VRYILIFLLLAGAALYLNRSYAYFYNFQRDHFMTNPLYPPQTELKKPDSGKHIKLAVLGDSLMAGTGTTSQEKSLAFLIAQNLAQNSNVTLINLAVPGVGVEDVLDRQVPQAIEENPDYIILMIGTNDVHNKLPEPVFKNYYSQILDQLTSTNAKISIINIPYIGSTNILYPPWDSIANSQIKKFNGDINDIAASKQLKVIDLYSQFESQFKDSSDLYSKDQFHPSDKGYALWANFVYENLNP
jgi:lysophospholipase L1-like esterase